MPGSGAGAAFGTRRRAAGGREAAAVAGALASAQATAVVRAVRVAGTALQADAEELFQPLQVAHFPAADEG